MSPFNEWIGDKDIFICVANINNELVQESTILISAQCPSFYMNTMAVTII